MAMAHPQTYTRRLKLNPSVIDMRIIVHEVCLKKPMIQIRDPRRQKKIPTTTISTPRDTLQRQ
jgi:hypothetical protein